MNNGVPGRFGTSGRRGYNVPDWRITMQRIGGLVALIGVSFAFLGPDLRASGGSPMPRSGGSSSMPSAPRKTPEEQAVGDYNAGLKVRDKVPALQRESAQATHV